MIRATALPMAIAGAVALAGLSGSALAADQALIDAAKKEGVVVYYSTRQLEAMRDFAAAFKAKYGIELQYSRHSNEGLVLKIVNEFNAKQPTADVFDGSTSFSELVKANVVEPYKVKEAEGFNPAHKDPSGTWTAMNIYIAGLAWNTDLVKAADVPKSIDDLLDPKWKGRKIVYGAQFNPSGIGGLIGWLEKNRGPEKTKEFLAKLKVQQTVGLDASPSGAADGIISGQYALCIGCLNQHIQRGKERGAPVEWSNTVQPIVSFFSHMGLVKNAKNPNAAKLFMEWISSEEGQLLVEKTFSIGARTVPGPYDNLKPGPKTFTAFAITPEIIQADMGRWMKLYETEVK